MTTHTVTTQGGGNIVTNTVMEDTSVSVVSNCTPTTSIAIIVAAAGLAAVGGAVAASGGSGGSVKKPYSAKNTNNRLGEFALSDPRYQSSQYAANSLGLAQTRLNSRMTGAAQLERNIYGSQANTIAATNRYATDSSQAMAMAAAAQGQSNSSFNNMALAEGEDYNNKYGALERANQGMTAEGDKMHDDDTRRWQDQVNIAMTQYKIRTKKRADTAKVIGGAFTGASSVLGSFGGK